jgi:hypothetical protein
MNLCGLLQLASKTDRELVADPVHGAVHVSLGNRVKLEKPAGRKPKPETVL